MLEHALIAHGAPTLARLKTGSLFALSCGDRAALEKEMAAVCPMLEAKGLILTVLKAEKERHLFYLYREGELRASLGRQDTRAFLRSLGYEGEGVEAALSQLRRRLRDTESFPHEIGIFLSYPLSDVQAFIENAGRNCLCSGCWKVYSNEKDALRTFARYKKCKAVYARMFAEGLSLSRLTVQARRAS